MMNTHIFLGDRWTDPSLKNKACILPKKANGKCYRGRNANILVEIDGKKVVVPGRRLNKAYHCFQCKELITKKDNGMLINKGTGNEIAQCDDCHFSEYGVHIYGGNLIYKEKEAKQ